MARTVHSYVALGDSFTAGLDPQGERPWADEVAAGLPGARYANLASVGATSEDVESFQLPEALALEPDLISLVCGANDVLESVRPDPAAYATRLRRMFAGIRAAAPNAEIFTISYPDLSRFVEFRPRTAARVAAGVELFNDALRHAAGRHGVLLLEAAASPQSEQRDNFASDGFHASEEGHRRIGLVALRALEETFAIDTRIKEIA